MSKPTVAIVGASTNREKFGNKAVRAYLQMGYDVYPVNPRGGELEGLPVFTSLADVPVEHLDRISFYLPPQVGIGMLEEVASQSHDQFWLNPGSESDEVVEKARALGLDPIVACSIIDVGMSPHQLD